MRFSIDAPYNSHCLHYKGYRDLQSVSLPVLLMHGRENDQVVPIDASARKAIDLLSHGLFATHPDIINADLLAFVTSEGQG